MKKTGIIIAIALLTSVSLYAQREYGTFSARISTFGQSFDRPSFELEFKKPMEFRPIRYATIMLGLITVGETYPLHSNLAGSLTVR